MRRRITRALAAVRRILWETWDPIGVNDASEATDEYDSYAPTIVRMIVDGADAHTLERHLAGIETRSMGLGAVASPRRTAAALALVALREEGLPPAVPLELLVEEPMASGATSLRLTRQVSWEEFPDYVEQLIELLDGSIDERVDTAVERVVAVTILGRPFWISLDDFDLGVSLDPRDPGAAGLIPELRRRLMRRTPMTERG